MVLLYPLRHFLSLYPNYWKILFFLFPCIICPVEWSDIYGLAEKGLSAFSIPIKSIFINFIMFFHVREVVKV